ncbi:MAG TPA: alpha/beta hydrolase [Gammaproteobacteria bacterium]|nr:alpha/beta hydrolase [Gammaproteobacteria bacterium]
MPETVMLVHGIWMTGLELRLLARRLQRCGYRTLVFRYPSLRRPLARNAARLVERVRRQGDTTVHLVGHSLGGLVILRALQDHPDLTRGRCVLLGSPVNGSVIARRLHRYRLTRWLIGRSGDGALLGGGPGWHGPGSPGIIAGTRPLGVGQLLGGFTESSDGTVALSETRLAGAHAATVFHCTHFGLLFSRPVARAVCGFLRTGRFPGPDETL